MTTRIHLGFHFYGAGNIGDDMMVQGFINELKDVAHAIRITCCTAFDIESQRRRFPEIEWLPYDIETRRKAVQACDIWLGFGDTPFQSDSGGWFFEHLRFEMELIREFDRPAYMLCVGVNDRDAVTNPETKLLLSHMRMVWTRDMASASALAEVAGWTRIQPTGDLANLYFERRREPHNPDTSEEPLLMVIHSEDPTHIDAAALNEVILGYPGPVYWYCQEVREFGCTEMATYRRLSEPARAKLTLVHPDYHAGSLKDIIAVFEHRGVCLTSRYHSAVMAAWMGWRVAVFARNAKLDGVIEQYRLSRVRSLTTAADIRAGLAAATFADANQLQGLRHSAHTACKSFFRLIEP